MTTLDLFSLRDEKTVLKNPHKGWYWHYIDQGYSRPGYRDDEEWIGDVSQFPGLAQIYLRFDWVDINPAKGVYDFSYLDRIMEEWGKRGFTFRLRMATYEGDRNRWGLNPRATPDYVREAGAKGFLYPFHDYYDPKITYSPDAWEPDYGDTIFLGYAEEVMQKLGERYDPDPRIESVDIGTFGKYGEGHTGCGVYGEDVLRRHIDITRSAFPDTLVLVNDDLLNHNPSITKALADYCISCGIGIRDDSVCVAGIAKSSPSYDTIRNTRLFAPFANVCPVDIEFAHASLIPADVWKGGFPAIEALQRTHATYAGFHDYPGRFYQNNPWFTEYVANHLGYWYRPDRIELHAHGGTFTVTNLGWAPSYRDYALHLYLRNEDGKELDMGKIAGSLSWKELSTVTVDFAFSNTLCPGEYTVSISLLDDKERPIALALTSSICTQGKYELGKVSISTAE